MKRKTYIYNWRKSNEKNIIFVIGGIHAVRTAYLFCGAESALLMDMKTGRVLYGKNIDERLFPASTTKMMTGILALESDSMNDTVTATYEAIKDITLQDSHMGILIGEELTMEQLVSGMLVYSANDAANVIAIHLAGSIEAFADKMNAKAQELGMQNTHFVNACGMTIIIIQLRRIWQFLHNTA